MKIGWKLCFRIGLSVFLLYLCIYYWPTVTRIAGILLHAAFPLILGCGIAYVVNLLMSAYEKLYFPHTGRKYLAASRRPVCLISAFLTVLLLIVVLAMVIWPQLASCVQLVLAEIPGAIRMLVSRTSAWGILPDDWIAFLNSIDWTSKIGQIIDLLTSGAGSVMDMAVSMVTSVFSGVVTALLSVIFAIYLLLGKDTLCRQSARFLRHYVPARWCDRILYVLSVLHDCFRRYIVGQCVEAVILGVLCTVGMLCLRLPYATMIGALVAFTALIPVAGAYIGGGVGAFLVLMESPWKALIFVIFIILLQQVEGNLIYPRVVGTSMGLPGIWVLAAVTVGGGVMGVTGMLFGVPIAATLYRLIRNDMNGSAPDHVSRKKGQPGDISANTNCNTVETHS